MSTQLQRAETLKALHEREGAFVIPNPWDIGSARLPATLGFEALATTSSGFANARGRTDGRLSLDEVVGHCRELSSATSLPISADLENCFAHNPEEAAKTIIRVAEAGVVGGSIEDYSGDASKPIYDFPLAVERVHAAAEAAQSLGFPFALTARAENLLYGRNDLDDTIRRLQAFADAGADVLYAPGLKTLEQVRIVVAAVSKPVNVLASFLPGVTVAELAEAGVRRISVGGALARAAATATAQAAIRMRDHGSFAWIADVLPGSEIERLAAGD
jgi:2-methylisocitrate lyase-like PEP mutase family enzyme